MFLCPADKASEALRLSLPVRPYTIDVPEAKTQQPMIEVVELKLGMKIQHHELYRVSNFHGRHM